MKFSYTFSYYFMQFCLRRETFHKKVLQTGKKQCRKMRNCSLQAISPFPTVFSEHLYSRHVKNQGLVWERVKTE